jgi:hypothetical protein
VGGQKIYACGNFLSAQAGNLRCLRLGRERRSDVPPLAGPRGGAQPDANEGEQHIRDDKRFLVAKNFRQEIYL